MSAQNSATSVVTSTSHVVIIGGGPGGYEAALVARQLGAQVTLVERDGCGGSAVLTDVVPSKTLVATAAHITFYERADNLGIHPIGGQPGDPVPLTLDLMSTNSRVLALAKAQSADIKLNLERAGVRVIAGTGKLAPDIELQGTRKVFITHNDGGHETVQANVVLVATGAAPRMLPSAMPDGERILTWKQLYNLSELPTHLIVVGSGVTGAELAGAYQTLGVQVTLISSRDQVIPGVDKEAAEIIETVFRRRGMTILNQARAERAERVGDQVYVYLSTGQKVVGSHCIMAVGGIPNTKGIGLEEAGVTFTPSGHIEVDRVSRSRAHGIYAAGDCTGVYPLASVAAMQGRIAMWHAFGDAVSPIDTTKVAANIFTAPEIATIGVQASAVERGEVDARVVKIELSRNPRAKMLGLTEGFIKIIASNQTNHVIGGLVVAPRASEYILPITLAVANCLTVDQLAQVYTVYPSLSGSITEAARQIHRI